MHNVNTNFSIFTFKYFNVIFVSLLLITYYSRTPEENVLSFTDRLPSATDLTDSTGYVVGGFNCNPNSDVAQQTIRVLLNDNYIDGGPINVPNAMGCWCPNCGSLIPLNLSKKTMDSYYFKGQENHMSINVVNNRQDNFLCLGEVDLKINFNVPDPQVTSVHPLFGPNSGGTLVTVNGDNFSPSLKINCLFGDEMRTEATILSDKTLQCKTKDGINLSKTSFGLVIKVLDNEYIYRSNFNFSFYSESEIKNVAPRKASYKKSTKIRVYGKFEETGTYNCKFESSTRKRIVGGSISSDGSYITCYSPTWDTKERVNLSVSLNDQQFSEPFTFRFADSK